MPFNRVFVSFVLVSCAVFLSACPGPPPKNGKYVELDGYKIFYVEEGENQLREDGSTTPTVLLASGLNDNLAVWNSVMAAISQETRVVAYDRAGNGWSDLGPNPRTGGLVALEMRAFLDAAEIPGPYLLVGHSFGGLFVRLFANAYPDDVVGMVLIDTVHEDRENRQALLLDPSTLQTLQTVQKFTTETVSSPGALGEFQNRVNTFQEIRAKRRLPDIPLVFLSRDKDEFSYLPRGSTEAFRLETELDEGQAALVPDGELRTVTGSGHVVQKDKPEAVIEAILDVMDAIVAGGLS